ncbi:thioredoxin domain-containing protein [Specibacter cremeus]|uniref:thioredoxin domain-containing protein n=1 Tax=Specibacter cremeus TaxID=1629051 RepID=UPI000F777D80|nr:thioredoxin domain-containing protein [Specibacter cremeus]
MNRLAGEPSAYLRQHAANPVDWQPWGAAAFAEAAERDVPVFLSIGYAACHWCHVMAHESFEDPATAAALNAHFVAIKVDREERPDVDAVYMDATQALSGQGGWPMSVFLLPDGRAFHAGTYFPPRPAPGRPSFRQVLEAVADAWTRRRPAVEANAAALADALARPDWPVAPGNVVVTDDDGGPGSAGGEPWLPLADAAVAALLVDEDPVHGGFGGAPKFPPTPGLEFLLRRAALPGGAAAQALAGRTLAAMVNSAVFDQLGGGFARYSVTADWSEPHYEKMLYDNAALLRVLAHWLRLPDHQAFPAVDARRALAATADWLFRELLLPGGGYASSLDADTVIDGVHHEGATYTWIRAEAGEPVAALMHLPADGSPGPLHPGRALTAGERAAWEAAAPRLWALRRGRPAPARDEKVVAGWNGMLLAALADAAATAGEPRYVRAAVDLAGYLRDVHWRGGRLARVSHDGAPGRMPGLLEDHAACADGYFALYAATGDARWYRLAEELILAAEARFLVDGVLLDGIPDAATDGDDGGALLRAAGGPRRADPFDNATASPAALLAGAFTTYAAYSGSTRHRELAESLLAPLPALVPRGVRAAGGLLAVTLACAAGPLEVAVVGADPEARAAMVRRVAGSPSPGLVLAAWDGVGAAPVPLLEGRGTTSVLAHVCRNMVCERPVGTVAELDALLR